MGIRSRKQRVHQRYVDWTPNDTVPSPVQNLYKGFNLKVTTSIPNLWYRWFARDGRAPRQYISINVTMLLRSAAAAAS